MKSTLLLLALVLISLTPLSAQTGKTRDTLTCYNKEELKKIAIKVVHANECDSLLNLSTEEINNLRLQVFTANAKADTKDEIIRAKDRAMSEVQHVIKIKDVQVEALKTDNAKLQKQAKVTKTGCIITSSLSLVLLVLLAL